jgi:2-keto-4-pentenoate hydratase
MKSIDELADYIDQPGIDGDPARDIIHICPEITQDQALAVQLAVKRRRVAAGDRIIGHQASFTSAGVRKMFPDAPEPMVGTLLASLARASGDEVTLDCEKVFIECELAMVLGKDLKGDNLTPIEVLSAIDGFLPAIEVAPLRPGVLDKAYSWPHLIAVQKAVGGYVVFGDTITSAKGFNPRLESCTVSIDGEERAVALGLEAMGNPLVVVAAMAARLHAIGEHLHAGQIIMTGSLPPPQPVTIENRVARADFPILGSVSVRLAC